MTHFQEGELDILKFISDKLHSYPEENFIHLDTIMETGTFLALNTAPFPSAWEALIQRGFLQHFTKGVAVVTPACVRYVRAVWP